MNTYTTTLGTAICYSVWILYGEAMTTVVLECYNLRGERYYMLVDLYKVDSRWVEDKRGHNCYSKDIATKALAYVTGQNIIEFNR